MYCAGRVISEAEPDVDEIKLTVMLKSWTRRWRSWWQPVSGEGQRTTELLEQRCAAMRASNGCARAATGGAVLAGAISC